MTDPATIAITFGLVNVGVTVGGIAFAMGILKGRLDRVEKDVGETKTLLVTAAVEADRLRRAEGDIERLSATVEGLRRGAGWVKDGDAHTVDREY